MARRSFFADLKFIDSRILRYEVSEQGQATFTSLVSFVEECTFTKSKSYQFICRNWRLNYSELEKKWVAEGNKYKQQSCFRVQLSCLSQMMYSLFPKFSREAFVYDDGDAFKDIEAVITTIEHFQGYPQFIREVYEHSDTASYSGGINPDECIEAVRKLSPLLKSEVYNYLNELDMNKVRYILSVLQKPLFSTYSVGCNTEKLVLLKALYESDAKLETGKQDKSVGIHGAREVFEKISYNLSITDKMAELLSAHASAAITMDEKQKYLSMPESERDKRKKNLSKLLSLFTKEGLEFQLSHYSPIEINEVLAGNYAVGNGEKPYKFKK